MPDYGSNNERAYCNMKQSQFFEPVPRTKSLRKYSSLLTADVNEKGVLDIDTVKGCTAGMKARPEGGCYNACYAAKIAKYRGIDFTVAVTRVAYSRSHRREIERAVKNAPQGFFRIGTMGDPCHAWEQTVKTVEWLGKFARPIIITKHWILATEEQLKRLAALRTVLNVSISALDTPSELKLRIREFNRYKNLGGESVARIVSCDFNRSNPEGERMAKIQEEIFLLNPTLDNPLRVNNTHSLVTSGIINLTKAKDLASMRTVSLMNPSTYLGHCESCSELCGISFFDNPETYHKIEIPSLFT